MIIFLQKIYQHDFFFSHPQTLRGMQIFHKNHGMTVSAGATFYAILSFMPLMLFSVTIIQKFFGTYFQFKATLFSYLSEFFPSTSNWVTQMVEQALKHQEGAKAGSSWLGLFILAWGSLSFLNAMFQGIEIISGKDLHRGFLRFVLNPSLLCW